jgi:dihydrofolate synthase/folylpolyglutamate synthase
MTHGGAPHEVVITSGLTRDEVALDWLLSFADMERGVGWNPRASTDEQWKLGRTRALLDSIGAPDRSLTCVLIAGTKGKGSTAAFLARILAAAGVRAGLYTQPHLQSYRERIRVDGVAITPLELDREVEVLRDAVASLRADHPGAGEPTTFELTTALSLHHFAASGCAVAILEAGLGGRLDATNAVSPAVSLITPISRDHLAILGPTLADVAREKAGILRRDRRAFIAPQLAEPGAALRDAVRRTGANATPVRPLGPQVAVALAGDHQRINAALAAAAARSIPGIAVSDHAIAEGLAHAAWPGRFEIVPGRPTFVLDGAHNDASAEAFATTLRPYAAGRPILLVAGVHADKEAEAVLRPLCAIASGAIATRSSGARALPAEEVARVCRSLGTPTDVEPGVASAIARTRAERGADTIVAVTGSLAVVGEARDALELPIVERLW